MVVFGDKVNDAEFNPWKTYLVVVHLSYVQIRLSLNDNLMLLP